tara:strand:- start:703 stop:1068 length:366 start_codon:yes stop_codon:yes gene_type:complete
MSFFSSIANFASSAASAVGSFFSSPKFQTARNIASGASSVVSVMREAAGRTDLSEPPQGLVNPKQDFSGRVSTAVSRSRAGTPSFGDISEATYTKYANLQNTVRYLYGEKSRYKSITKSRS